MRILFPPRPPLPPLLPHVPPNCQLSFLLMPMQAVLSPCTHAGVAPMPTSKRLTPSCLSSRIAHHVDCHLSFLFLPTAGESSALPPCCIIEGEKLPQRTLNIDDNVASKDRRSRSTCCWMDRSRRSSLFTLCGIVLILLLVVDAGVVSSIPRPVPFDALIINEGGGIVPAGIGGRCPLPSLLLLVPVDAHRSLLPLGTSTGISSMPEASCVSAPDDGPTWTPTLRCQSQPPSKDERRNPATA